VFDPLQNKLIAHLPRREVKALSEAASLVEFARGVIAQKEGREVATVYFPLSGMLSLLVVLKGGRTVETSVVGREGMVERTIRPTNLLFVS
jgi:CRP-like cAMP-binding protein